MFMWNAIVLVMCVALISADNFKENSESVWLPKDQLTNLQDLVADNAKVSEGCSKQRAQFRQDLKLRETWAWEMIDASSKIPTGILSGTAGDLGNFDQCLNVKGNTKEGIIRGKYCIGELPTKFGQRSDQNGTANLIKFTLSKALVVTKTELILGICLPDACLAADFQTIYRNIVKFSDNTCQTKESQPKLDAVAITTIALLGVTATLMTLSTVYDVYNYYSKLKPHHNLLTAFSVFTNGKKLLTTNNSQSQISCLHGIRTITMMWILLGHRYRELIEVFLVNRKEAQEWMGDFSNSYITGAAVSVDSFLLMSGLVISYSFMVAMKKGLRFNIFLYYFHRYLRLTPPYAAIILINVSLLKHLGSGPQWPSLVQKTLQEPCRKYWWSALLYVQNYVNPEQPCMMHTWYLSVDTQLFLLSPLLLIPFLKWPRIKPYVLLILIIAAAVTTFLLCWFEELYLATIYLDPPKLLDFLKKVYYATHARASPWLIGLATGYIIHATRKKNFVRMFGIHHHLMSGILWISSLCVLLACVCGSYDIMNGEFSLVAQTTYTAFTGPAWSIALSCIILLCVHGYGGPVNWLLSNPVMQVISKFTYSMYLLHRTILTIYIYSARNVIRFSNFEVWHSFWGDFIFTFALAVLWILAFESPVVVLEKFLFGRGEEKKSLQSQSNDALSKTSEDPERLNKLTA